MTQSAGFYVSVHCLALYVTILGANAKANEHSKEETAQYIAALESAIGAVPTFDVTFDGTRTFLMSWTPIEKNGQVTGFLASPRSEPKVERFRSRQVFSAGKRRLEKLDLASNRAVQIIAANDEVERVWHAPGFEAIIRQPGASSNDHGADYQETFRSLFGPLGVVFMLRERGSDVRSYFSPKDGRYVVFEIDPTRKIVTFGKWGYRVFADTSCNMLPGIIETFINVDDERVVINRKTILERKEVMPGVKVPVRALWENFNGSKGSQHFRARESAVEITVDQSRSRWNTPINDDEFTVAIPKGAKVIDEIRNTAFVTGKPDPGKNLDDLAAHARQVVTGIRPERPKPSRAWIWWAAGGVVAIVTLAGVLYFRRHRAKVAP